MRKNLQFLRDVLTEWIFSVVGEIKWVGSETPNGCFPLTFPFSNKLCLFGRGSTAAAAIYHKVPTGWNVTEQPGWWILIASIDPADRTAVRSWWHHPSSASPWWHIDSSSNLSRPAAHLHAGLLVGFLENKKRNLWIFSPCSLNHSGVV